MSGPNQGEPLRLQIYVSDLGATGVVRNAVGIANAAAANGYDVRLLTSVADGGLRGEIDPSVAIVELLKTGSAQGERKRWQRRALAPYRRHTREWRPDLLFSAGNHGHLLSAAAWRGLPGCRILRISNALDQERPGRGVLSRVYRGWKFRTLLAGADRLVLVSNALADHPLLAPLVQSGKAVVIPNGVDIERVRQGAAEPCSHPWLQGGDIPVVLAVGRHVPQKNHAVLLDGFALARGERPIRLLFLGEGSTEAIELLRAQARHLRVEEDVTFEPPVPNPFPYMAAASVFALPSRWEGSSNVLLEALACGIPVIASPTAGDAEAIIGEGRYGVLADPGDPQAWAQAILRQLGSRAVLPGNRAESFSRDAAIARYLELFRTCAPSGASQRP